MTLEKSEREYSPSTLYKDYAISPALFHWESQSTTTEPSKTGQRYIHHRNRGGNHRRDNTMVSTAFGLGAVVTFERY